METRNRDDPDGIRTRVAALKGPCPRPLDDGASASPIQRILEVPPPAVKFAHPAVASLPHPRCPAKDRSPIMTIGRNRSPQPERRSSDHFTRKVLTHGQQECRGIHHG